MNDRSYFSSRLQWNLESNRLSKLLETKRREGGRILDLTESNPTRAGFVYPEAEILNALTNRAAMGYEPNPRGPVVARKAVGQYYHDRGLQVEADYVHLTASTSEAYAFVFKLLADHGDAVLVPRPSYPLFDFLAGLEGVRLRPYELSYLHPRGWRIDMESVRSSIDDKTRAVILVNPNNPTGSFLKHDELEALNQICREHRLALIADEVFGDYGFEEDRDRVASLVENEATLTFVMSGLSKILALPQMKLAWIITNGPGQLRAEAVERLDFVADTFLSVSAPVSHAAADWLPLRNSLQQQIRERTRVNLETLTELAANSPFRVLSCEGGWYATVEAPRIFSEEEWALRLLEEDGVLVHPGYFFDFTREAYLILSLLTGPADFREAIERMLDRVH
jgi:alanine-synthesizing transaminase